VWPRRLVVQRTARDEMDRGLCTRAHP